MCELPALRIRLPAQGHQDHAARPDGQPADRANAEKMPKEFEINMLRCIFCGFCQEVCPEEAIFLQKDYSLTGTSREEMIYNKEKLLALGGTHAGIQKWKHKLERPRRRKFPVKVCLKLPHHDQPYLMPQAPMTAGLSLLTICSAGSEMEFPR
jgi:ferredoxin